MPGHGDREVFLGQVEDGMASRPDLDKTARRSLRASSRCEIGTSLGIDRPAVDIQTGVTRFAQLERRDFFPRLQAAFNGVHGIAKGFFERPLPGQAAFDGRHPGGEHAVLVLEVINRELVIRLHGFQLRRPAALRQAYGRRQQKVRFGRPNS